MKDDENRMKFLCDPEQHKLTLALHRQENLRANRAEVELATVTAERDALLATKMTEKKAREVLGIGINPDNSIISDEPGVTYYPNQRDPAKCLLHGFLTVDMMKAMIWWMENKGEGR